MNVHLELQTSRQFLASALDLLPANVAILDETGTIVSVNAAWRRFADENSLDWPDYGVGRNYLAAAESASDDPSTRAKQALKGIRELIAGQRDQFYLEYACHSPNERRWFEMRATRSHTRGGVWLVIAHENITQRKQAEMELQRMTRHSLTRQRMTRALGQRVKELNCLYGISRLAGSQAATLEEILQGTVELIPPAWQYPDITCARITLDGHEFRTKNFRESTWRQTATLRVHAEQAGEVEVGYLAQKPDRDEGPFLKAERDLLNAIAEQLGRITAHIRAEALLQQAKESAVAARSEEQERLREAERRRQIAEGLGDVLAALNSNQSLEEVLDLIAAQARRLLDARAVGIYSLGAEFGTLAVEASKGLLITYVAGSNIPIGQESLRQAMISGRPVAVPDVTTFPSDIGVLSPDVIRHTSARSWADLYRAWLAVPIFSKGEIYGGILLYYAEPRVFFEDEIELVVAFADQAALAIENSRLRDQIERAATSAERDRLARELHDAVTQTLFSASLIAEAMPRVWVSRPEEAQRGLDELRHLTRGALAEMRTMLVELRPAALTEKPLGELLRHLTEAMTSRTRVPITLTVEGNSSLEPNLQIALYRIAQEALNNVAKHAGASQATVTVQCRPGSVDLHIRDDGCGFDPSDIRPDRMGMGIMRERAQAVGAILRIDSRPGHGTQVIVAWQDAKGEG